MVAITLTVAGVVDLLEILVVVALYMMKIQSQAVVVEVVFD